MRGEVPLEQLKEEVQEVGSVVDTELYSDRLELVVDSEKCPAVAKVLDGYQKHHNLTKKSKTVNGTNRHYIISSE